MEEFRIAGERLDETPGDGMKRFQVAKRFRRGKRVNLHVETWKRGNRLAEIAEKLESEDLEVVVKRKPREKRRKQREKLRKERNARRGKRRNQQSPAGEVEKRLRSIGILVGFDEFGEIGHRCDLGQLGQDGL